MRIKICNIYIHNKLTGPVNVVTPTTTTQTLPVCGSIENCAVYVIYIYMKINF